MPPSGAPRPVLVGGHESAGGTELTHLLPEVPDAVVTSPGRALDAHVTALLAQGTGPVVVLPMTWGRDPRLVADTARTLRWLAAGVGRGRVALTAPFGTTDHLVALLRRAVARAVGERQGVGVVIAAHRADPFDDAELHRVVHLVRTHGTEAEIEAACVGGAPDLARAVRRVRLLGARDVAVVPADFGVPDVTGLPGVVAGGPLLSAHAVARIVRERVAAAEHALRHGDDGVAAGLLADHEHGYAHSHGPQDAGHTHGGVPHVHGGTSHSHGTAPTHDPHATELAHSHPA